MSIQVVADPHSSCTETQKGNFARAPNSEPEATSHGEQGEEATSSHSTQAEHMQYDATENNTCEDACSDNEYCLRCMDKTIDAELARRQFWINLDPSIHHFNYDGQGVYDPTDTSPGECFAIIMAQKRHQESRSPGAYRIRSIINRARLFLDPIAGIVDADMLHLRGSELAQAVEGKVKKSYSTHGRWQFIEREAEEIYVSPAIPQCYLEANIILTVDLCALLKSIWRRSTWLKDPHHTFQAQRAIVGSGIGSHCPLPSAFIRCERLPMIPILNSIPHEDHFRPLHAVLLHPRPFSHHFLKQTPLIWHQSD